MAVTVGKGGIRAGVNVDGARGGTTGEGETGLKGNGVAHMGNNSTGFDDVVGTEFICGGMVNSSSSESPADTPGWKGRSHVSLDSMKTT